MITNSREFQRNFRAMRERAKAGEEIIVQEASVRYTFMVQREEVATFGEGAADLIGAFDSGIGDLASNPEHLKGYGSR